MEVGTPDLFSVTTMFSEADEEIDQWRASNQSLQKEIEELQRMVRSLTRNANEIQQECNKPRLASLRVDPSVKLRVGNTRDKASLWEEKKKAQL